MKKMEKEYLLSLFLDQNESDSDIICFANEGFGISVFHIESNATPFKSIFESESKQIFINELFTNSDEASFLVCYHLAEYILKDGKRVSMICLDNMDADVYKLAQKIYQKSESIKNKQLKKGK